MKKNLANQNIAAQINSVTTGGPITSGVSIFLNPNNTGQVAGTGVLVHAGNGSWVYTPTQAETNYNYIAFTFVCATGINQTINVYPSEWSLLGPGAIATVVTVEDVTPLPIAQADVWVTTDILGANVIASGQSDNFGHITFYFDSGTYYSWAQKAGVNFSNPQTFVV
jgi:hypothetical protein